MRVRLDSYYPVVFFLQTALPCVCKIDSSRIHICDRGWEILVKIDDAENLNITAVARFALDLCTALLQYNEAHFELFAQIDQDHGEIRIPYKDCEASLLYDACVRDNKRFTVLDTVTT